MYLRTTQSSVNARTENLGLLRGIDISLFVLRSKDSFQYFAVSFEEGEAIRERLALFF